MLSLNPKRFLFLIVAILVVVVEAAPSQAQPKEEIKLWPNGLPAGSIALTPKRVKELKAKEAAHKQGYKLYVDSPTLVVYPAPEESANGCAVVVCPGGGYNVLAWKHEGLDIAEWLNSFGVTAFVLKYRVPRRGGKIHREPMQDVQRAIRLVRQNDTKYGIDSSRVGVLGFSAGGHLTVMSGVQYDTKCYESVDEADKQSARPDFICPIYAAYLGDNYKDDKAELGPLISVTKDTPPTFMAVTWDDRFRGAQSALLFARLREHDVPAELHAYSTGGHGYGIAKTGKPVSGWPDQLKAWMKQSGFLTPGQQVE